MKYLDYITSALLEMEIFEMAFQRKNVIEKTRNLSVHIARHISKVALWPQHSARKHWEKEIQAALSTISDLRYDGKKYLKENEYFNLLYLEPFENTDFVEHVAKSSIKIDKMFDHKWTDSEIFTINSKIKQLYHEISKQLAENKYEHISDTLKNCGI